MPSWPDSMRTLSSRLSIRRVRRSVPRSSDSTSSFCCSRDIVSRPSRSSSIDASCAASGVRNSCEMFASTESRARRTPSSSVSSRMTCTCSSSTGAALVMIVVRGAPFAEVQLLGRLRIAFDARAQDRAARLARSLPFSDARLQHVAAESADRLVRLHAEQPRGLRIQIANDARLVDRVDAFDDAAEHGLRLGLAPTQRRRSARTRLLRMSSIVRASLPTSLRAADRNRGREIAVAELSDRIGQRARPDR